MHRACIGRASGTHRARVERRGYVHRADTMRHTRTCRAGEIVRPSSMLLENSISASCFLPIKKEGVLKAKPQTRHRAWLICNERRLIEHASSEQKKQIERRPSCDPAGIERRSSGNRAGIERRSSTHGISFERLDNRAFQAARYVT